MKERLCEAQSEVNVEVVDNGVTIYEWDGTGDNSGVFIPKEFIGKLNKILLKAQQELKV